MPKDQILISPERGIERPLGERIRTVASLTVTWTRRDLRVRYRQSVLRSSWSLLQPLTILATYGLVLTAVLDVRSDDAPYLTFAWSGLILYTFFSQALSLGVGSIQQASSIISRVYFPREVLPLSVIGGALIDLAIMLVTLVVLVWVQVGPPPVQIVALPLVLVMLVAWTVAATLFAATLTTFRRDLNFAVPLFLRVLFIVTPVMYPASLIDQISPVLVDVNPLAVAIESARDVVYRGVWPDWPLLGLQLGAALVVLAVVYRMFLRLEPRMADFA